MLNLDDRLHPNTDEVVGDIIDGEAIIINLGTGVYYSMEGVGGLIWKLIEARHSLGEIATAIVARYEVSLEQAQADLQRLASELLREKLTVAADGEAPGQMDRVPTPEPKLPYDPPKVTTYRDMGDLLALDPPAPGLRNIPWNPPNGGSPD